MKKNHKTLEKYFLFSIKLANLFYVANGRVLVNPVWAHFW